MAELPTLGDPKSANPRVDEQLEVLYIDSSCEIPTIPDRGRLLEVENKGVRGRRGQVRRTSVASSGAMIAGS